MGAKVKVINGQADPMGYSGVNSTIKTNAGISGEIQVNSPQMIFAKENEALARNMLGNDTYQTIADRAGVPGGLGHQYYEQWRVLNRTSAEAERIAAESRNYYNQVRGAGNGTISVDGTNRIGFTGAGETAINSEAEQAYAAIRSRHMNDIPAIAENTGLSVPQATTLKKHLFFGQHSLPLEGGTGFKLSRFAADDEIAFAWKSAQEGTLTTEGQTWFKQLANHELVERQLMGQGIPYRNPAAWDANLGSFRSTPPGAHDLAPRQPGYGTFPGFELNW